MPFYHFDVYRIGDIEEMDEIGYEDYFYGDGLCLAYGQQQHAGHHHEERHAAPDQTAGESAGQKRAAIGVELPHEGVAAVGENDQKTGQHTQQVYPADVLSARKRIFHLFEV